MSIPNNEKENSERIAEEATVLLEVLAEILQNSNPNSRSFDLRNEYYEILDMLITELHTSINADDLTKLNLAVYLLENTLEWIEWNNEVALEQLKHLYGDFLDEHLELTGIKKHWINIILYKKWTKLTNKPFNQIPNKILEIYQDEIFIRVENNLNLIAGRLKRYKVIGLLVPSDVPLQITLLNPKPFELIAENLIRHHSNLNKKHQQIESENLALPSLLWDLIGVDSYRELAFDISLLFVSGGVGGFVKLGKTIRKGYQIKKKLGSSKKMKKALKATRKTLKEIEKINEKLRKRLKKLQKKSKKRKRKKTQNQLGRQSRRAKRLTQEILELLNSLNKSKEIGRELITALKPIKNILFDISANGIAKNILHTNLSLEDAHQETVNYFTQEFLMKRYAFFGDIEGLGMKLQRCTYCSVGKKMSLHSKVFIRLYLRQVIANLIVTRRFFDSNTKSFFDWETFRQILIESAIGAVSDYLLILLPDTLANQVVTKVSSEVLVGFTNGSSQWTFNKLESMFFELQRKNGSYELRYE